MRKIMQPLIFFLFFSKKSCNLSQKKIKIKKITQFLKNCIGPTIRIGRDSWCLPYAGFFLCDLLKINRTFNKIGDGVCRAAPGFARLC